MSIDNAEIWTPVVGGILVSLGTTFFYLSHHQKLNLSDALWATMAFRPNLLPEYFALIAGFFSISGIAFDSVGYDNLNGFSPYGSEDQILNRSSMYGFALSGLLIGLGSKLAKGDIVYHGFIGVASQSSRSIIATICMLSFGMLSAWLANTGWIDFLTNEQINPQMPFIHIASANVCIILSCILFCASFCLITETLNTPAEALKKIMGSLASGAFIALGTLTCGFADRNVLISSLCPGANWQPRLVIFLGVIILLNTITIYFFFKKVLWVTQDLQAVLFFENEESKEISTKMVAGSIMFGVGWGLGGLDLTTFLIQSAIFSIPVVIVFGAFLLIGILLGNIFE